MHGRHHLDDRDLVSLTAYLRPELSIDPGVELRLDSEHRGHQNVNAVVSDGHRSWVIRFRIHESPNWSTMPVHEEYGVLRALERQSVPVATPLAVCTDPRVIGRPFLVTSRVEGTIVHERSDAERLTPTGARRCSEGLVDALATLHACPPGLDGTVVLDPGPTIGERMRHSAELRDTGPGTELSKLFAELEREVSVRLPTPQRRSIVHGDYRLGNAILSTEVPGAVAAIIDWEKVHLDDPLVDLARFYCLWNHPATSCLVPEAAIPRPDLGFLSREALLVRYESASGLDLSEFFVYEMAALHGLALFVEFARSMHGGTRAPDTGPRSTEHLVRTALELADRS